MQISIEKRHLFILLALIIFLAGVILVFAANPTTKPNPGHFSTEVNINVGGADKNLQQAYDDGDFLTNIPEEFTTCDVLITTTTSDRVSWTPIDVPGKCRGRPCKIVMTIYKTISGVDKAVGIGLGDYYQAENEGDSTTERWETVGGQLGGAQAGNNGDTAATNIAALASQYLRDDMSGVEISKTQWAYDDDSLTYGMTIKTCNY